MNKIRKRSLIISIIIAIIGVGIIGFSYAWFVANLSGGASTTITANTSTLDNLVFITDSEISIVANQTNFKAGAGNLSGSTSPQVKLTAGNGGSTSQNYTASVVINSNNFIYTSGTTPELRLTVTKNGTTLINNMDITTKKGTILIPTAANGTDYIHAIMAGAGATTTDEWVATITFVNLDSNQNANINKELHASIVFNNSDNGNNVSTTGTKLSNYRIYGNSVQAGTPSVDNPIPILSVGDYDSSTNKYKIPINVTGKNLLKLTPASNPTAGVVVTNDSITITKKSTAVSYYAPGLKLKPNTRYTVSGKVEGQFTGRIYAFYGNSLQSSSISNNQFSFYFLTNDTGIDNDKGRLYIYQNNSSPSVNMNLITDTVRIYDIQLEEGTTATAYEAYRNNTTNILLDEPLRKIGDYVDYIDYANQKVVRYTGAHTFNGTETWNFRVNNNTSYVSAYMGSAPFTTASGDTLHDNTLNDEFMSNYLPYNITQKSTTYTSRTIPTVLGYGDTSAAFMITAPSSVGTTLAEWKSWVGTHNLEIQYILASPVETTISLPDVTTISGNNNISVGTSIQPSSTLFN